MFPRNSLVILAAIVRRLLLLALAGVAAGCATPEPAAAALTLRVTARQYAWTFEYPGQVSSEELHVPAGREVVLTLTSRDVLHTLAVPEFGVKEDAVPGRTSRVSFVPRTPGAYEARCAEYCGPGHSRCGAKVVVHEPSDFERWLASPKAK